MADAGATIHLRTAVPPSANIRIAAQTWDGVATLTSTAVVRNAQTCGRVKHLVVQ